MSDTCQPGFNTGLQQAISNEEDMKLYERIIETTICYKLQKYYGGGEIKIITSFNSRSNLVSGRSEPYLFIASAYVSLGKGFGNSTPLISRKTCNKKIYIKQNLQTSTPSHFNIYLFLK